MIKEESRLILAFYVVSDQKKVFHSHTSKRKQKYDQVELEELTYLSQTNAKKKLKKIKKTIFKIYSSYDVFLG